MASNMPDGFICRCPPVSARRPRKDRALFPAVCLGAEGRPRLPRLHGEPSRWGGFLTLAPAEDSEFPIQSC